MKKAALLSAAAFVLMGAKAPDRSKVVSFVVLGDSYSAGTGLETKDDAWPAILRNLIQTSASDCEAPVVIARSGWTAGELRDAIDADKPDRAFTWAIVFVGVNNDFRGHPVDRFMPEFRQVLDRALPLTGNVKKRVVVVSVPDYGVTPYGKKFNPERIAASIETYNLAMRKEALARGHRFINVTEISRFAATNPKMLSPDGLHPSRLMHESWAREILQAMRDTFGDLYGKPKP